MTLWRSTASQHSCAYKSNTNLCCTSSPHTHSAPVGHTSIVQSSCSPGKCPLHDSVHCTCNAVLCTRRYFASYLRRTKSGGPINISVHCDLAIFELLLTFLEGPHDIMRAMVRDMALAMPIFISSNFLKVCAQASVRHAQRA